MSKLRFQLWLFVVLSYFLFQIVCGLVPENKIEKRTQEYAQLGGYHEIKP